MGIVIPWDFSQRLSEGGPVQVQALVDATDDNTANVLIGYAQAVVQGYSAEIQLDWLRQRGQSIQPARERGNPHLVQRGSGKQRLHHSRRAGLVMSVIGAFLTSLTIAREWERGSMEQLISTPVSAMEIMLGKLAPYFVLGMFDVIVCAVIAIYWFHVPFRGSYPYAAGQLRLFMVVVLSLGFFISVLAKNQFAASQIALLVTFLPAFLLSGFLFSIEQMPVALQWITRILPARYYVSC
jgi:ABC-2 type transport system permease protein